MFLAFGGGGGWSRDRGRESPSCLQIGSDWVLGTPLRPGEWLQSEGGVGGVARTYSPLYMLCPGAIFKFPFAGLRS